MKTTVIPVVVEALEKKVPKNLEKRLDEIEIWGRIETNQTTPLLISARILRIVLDICGDLLSLRILGKSSVRVGVKNLQGVKYYSYYYYYYYYYK